MEPTDSSPDEEGPAAGSPSRPWGPGLPAPGAPVSAFDVARDEEVAASTATALYEAARFPDLGDVAAPPSGSSAPTGATGEKAEKDEDGGKGGLRILGVPAPKEVAGPILAALALAALAYGWRRRRRRR